MLSVEELEINANTITVEKDTKIILLKGNVTAIDSENNKVFTESAKYNKSKGIFNTIGFTKLVTAEGYEFFSENIYFDNIKKIISSSNDTKVVDVDNNQIFLKTFNYLINDNLILSKDDVKILDINKNEYNFSELYINEKDKKIVGSDVKFNLNQDDLKVVKTNTPRLYSNTVTIDGDQTQFQKGVFTYCKIREKNKCPPWIIQSKKIKHDATKKTIYYDKATLKIYDFPIFFFPKFSHPDPTVKRRSGFLLPSFINTSNLGSGVNIPYYYTLGKDKDFTFTPRIYGEENPLFVGEYRQDFKNSFLITDFGWTKGYKKNTQNKFTGSNTHLFSKFNYNFLNEDSKFNNLDFKIEKVSNDTYLKTYKVNSELVNNDINVLENAITHNYQNEDLFIGTSFSMFDDLTITDNNKYEYLLPYARLSKNLLRSEKYGSFDLNSKLRVKNYDIDKQTEFFVNDINWKSKKWISDVGIESRFESILKSVNYNADETEEYKNKDKNSELSGALGLLFKYPLFKENTNKDIYNQFTPKFFARYAPGHMRKLKPESSSLTYGNLYDLNKTSDIDVVEKGLSATLGFEYKKNKLNKDKSLGENISSFSIGQVINEKENHELSSKSSLDQRFSDVVGEANFKINQGLNFKYDFALDQNFEDINYSEVGLNYDLNNTKFNIGYLEEKDHRGNQEYIKSEITLNFQDSNALSFSTKRNLLSNSAEFYNFSYDYINDCLKAGLVFRREFYTDRDLEPENSLMFRITIVPFGQVDGPKYFK